jgi:hypothetical protein
MIDNFTKVFKLSIFLKNKASIWTIDPRNFEGVLNVFADSQMCVALELLYSYTLLRTDHL